MFLPDLLLTPRVLTAVLVTLVASVLLAVLALRSGGATSPRQLRLRTVSVVGLFLLLGYPAAFGLIHAPSLVRVVSADPGPLLGLAAALALVTAPKQRRDSDRLRVIIAAVAISGGLFLGLRSAIGITVATMWPGLPLAVATALLAWVGSGLAENLGKLLGKRVPPDDARHSALRLALLPVTLLPALVFYEAALGLALAP